MSQAINLPGLQVTSTKRSHPLTADKIQKRRDSGKFKSITGRAKGSSNLMATKRAVFNHIRKLDSKYAANDELATVHYDIFNMIAGSWSLLQNFYMEHKEADTDLTKTSDQLYFINRFWLNANLDDFASNEEVEARFATSHSNLSAQELAGQVVALRTAFDVFFVQQERVSAQHKSQTSKAGVQDFAQLQAELGALTDYSASSAIATYIKKYRKSLKTTAKSSRRVGAHSLAKFLTLESPSNVIYISKRKTKEGHADVHAQEKVRSLSDRAIAPFASLPYIRISNDANVIQAYLNRLRSHPDLVAFELAKPQFSSTRFAVLATDDEVTKLRKVNEFINELDREYNSFVAHQTQITTNVVYQPQPVIQPGTFAAVPATTLQPGALQGVMGGLGLRR